MQYSSAVGCLNSSNGIGHVFAFHIFSILLGVKRAALMFFRHITVQHACVLMPVLQSATIVIPFKLSFTYQ